MSDWLAPLIALSGQLTSTAAASETASPTD